MRVGVAKGWSWKCWGELRNSGGKFSNWEGRIKNFEECFVVSWGKGKSLEIKSRRIRRSSGRESWTGRNNKGKSDFRKENNYSIERINWTKRIKTWKKSWISRGKVRIIEEKYLSRWIIKWILKRTKWKQTRNYDKSFRHTGGHRRK